MKTSERVCVQPKPLCDRWFTNGPLRVVAAGLALLCLSSQAQNTAQGTMQIPSAGLYEWPLKAVEDTPDAVVQAGLLQAALDKTQGANSRERLQLLEAFLADYPQSSWTPSIRLALGRYWLYAGGYTSALEHWGRAWDETKNVPFGQGKEIADYALAHYTRLLALLGRTDELTAVLIEAGRRQLDAGPLTQKFLNTHDMYWALQQHPEKGINAVGRFSTSCRFFYGIGRCRATGQWNYIKRATCSTPVP